MSQSFVDSQGQTLESNIEEYFNAGRLVTHQRIDRFFAYLMLTQWICGIIAALIISPQSWSGTSSTIHPHVWSAIFLGGAASLFPAFLAVRCPGQVSTRHIIAVAQMLTSALFVHISGGRIETHFHIFGSLALLAFYADWPVLVTAAIVTALDHILRGVYFPLSVYGVAYASIWRSVEHTAWVTFETGFLIWSCRLATKDALEVATKRAELEFINERFVDRTGELLKARDAIREREETMHAILDTAADTIITLTDSGEIATASAAAVPLFGYSMKELIGRPFSTLLQESSHARLTQTLNSLGTQPGITVSHCSLVLKTKMGTAPTVEVSLSEMVVNTTRMFTAIIRDITERKLLEIQLHQAQKLESIGQLAAGIAHEINTPIQFVGDNTRFLQDEFVNIKTLLHSCATFAKSLPLAREESDAKAKDLVTALEKVDVPYLSDEIPKALQQSLEGISRVTHIVRAMKEFSHPGTTEKQMVDLNRAIESTIVISTNEWKYVADVDMQFDRSLPLVPCLPGEFNQVILNLLVNSAHALEGVADRGPNGKGRITVSTHKKGDWVEIRLQDTGTGISKKIADKVFDPFFTTKEVGKGTGQGLAIARSIIANKHGGSIEFESEEGKGTTFIICLPLKENPAPLSSPLASAKNPHLTDTLGQP